MYGFQHAGMNMGWLGIIFMLLIPLLVIVLLVRLFSGDRAGRPPPSAREILDARYARGEIDADEYRKRLDDINGL